MTTIEQAVFDDFCSDIAVDSLDKEYYDFHKFRYRHLVQTILELNHNKPLHAILDIGASFQTRLLDNQLKNVTLDTLGFTLNRFKPCNNPTSDTGFDLINCGTDKAELLEIRGKYDLIILAEVIEHMPIRPERIIKTLHSLLQPDGLLIVQTPNAAFIGNRIKLLCGYNPNMWIREDVKNPGHFREYTNQELIKLANLTKFDVLSIHGKNYFNYPSKIKRYALKLVSILPETMKNGFTMILKKQS